MKFLVLFTIRIYAIVLGLAGVALVFGGGLAGETPYEWLRKETTSPV